MTQLVVLDADVLGRQRTGDETYVENLLRHLPALGGGEFRFAAVTRRPELVPEGVEPARLSTSTQELRMAWSLPRLLRRLKPALAHFQHALPLRCPCPAVVTIHDLSFERDAAAMGRADRLVFKRVVPRGTGDRRQRAHEARPGRSLRHSAREDHRHPARRRSCLRSGRGGG
jgi:glycosyl transferase family 4